MLSHSARNITVLVHFSPSQSVVYIHSRQRLSEKKSLNEKPTVHFLLSTKLKDRMKDNAAPYLRDVNLKKLIKCQYYVSYVSASGSQLCCEPNADRPPNIFRKCF